MDQEEWYEIERETIKKLNSINIIDEISGKREDLNDLMDRLEEKYPFECRSVTSLFDGFGIEEFKDYLYKRYKNNECYTYEYISVDIIKSI